MKLLLVHRITSMLAAYYESLHGNTLLSVHKNYGMHVCMLQLLHGNDIDCFGLDFVSSHIWRVLRNLSFVVLIICLPFQIAAVSSSWTVNCIFNWELHLQLGIASSTGNCIFNWELHLQLGILCTNNNFISMHQPPI